MDYQTEINRLNELDILALTIYGEARGECVEGQIAVGNIIRNRVVALKKTYRDICLADKQFSCWNTNDPNYIILGEAAKKLNNLGTIDSTFNQIMWIAKGLMRNEIKDNVKGAQNYLTQYMYNSPERPHWANNAKWTQLIDNHIFVKV